MIKFKKKLDEINSDYWLTLELIRQNLNARCNEIANNESVGDLLDTYRYCVNGGHISVTYLIACRTTCHKTIDNVTFEVKVPSDYNDAEIRAWVHVGIDGQEMSVLVSISDSGIRFVRGARYYDQVNRCWSLPTEFSDRTYASCVATSFDDDGNFLIHNLFDETSKKPIRPLTSDEFNEILNSLEKTLPGYCNEAISEFGKALDNHKNEMKYGQVQ